MTPPPPSAPTRFRPARDGFTLLELMVVIGIISIMMVLVVPAFTRIKAADQIVDAAHTITGILAQARTYAMANNTYVWVGFYEENATTAAPTNATPPYPGAGRVIMATVYSLDGTKIYEDDDPDAPLPPARTRQLGRLTNVEGVHLTDLGAPPQPLPNPTPNPDSLEGRPPTPYAEGSPFDHYNRISSDDPLNKQTDGDQTKFPFTAQNYTFYKTVRFSPRGEANLNGTYSLKRAAEIGLRPTHGDVADVASKNVIAIQFSGLGGNFKIYRR